MEEQPEFPTSSGPPREVVMTGNGRIISFEAAIALIVAFVNLALDQADIHIMLVSWISIAACIALAVDILRRTKWTARAVHGRKRLAIGSGVILLAFVAFGVFLSVHKTDTRGNMMERARNIPPGQAPSSPQPETHKVDPPSANKPEQTKIALKKVAESRRVGGGTASGSVGTLTLGPCSVAQVGGIGNQATGGKCGPPSYPTLNESKLASALSAQQASVAFTTRNATGPTLAFANTLAGMFHDAQWSYAAPGIEIAGTDIGPDGRPVSIPTGLHIYAKTQTDATAVFVKKQFKDVANLDSVIESATNLRGMDIVIFVGEPESKRIEAETSRQRK